MSCVIIVFYHPCIVLSLYYVIGIVPHVVIADHLWQLTLVINQTFPCASCLGHYVYKCCVCKAPCIYNLSLICRRFTEQCNIHTVVGRALEPLDQLLTDTMQQTESIVKPPVCNCIAYVYLKPTPKCIKRISVYQTYIVCYRTLYLE